MPVGNVEVTRREFILGSIAGGVILAGSAQAQEAPHDVVVKTKAGDITLRPIKHATVIILIKSKTWYIDPAQLPAGREYPKADVLLITHEHGDHYDPGAIQQLKKEGTIIVTNPRVGEKVEGAVVMKNGDTKEVGGVKIEAIPAYNVVRKQFHPQGRDNGYILNVGGKRIYFAGDTEGTPEMKALKNIDVAFLPINLPYTMPPAEAAEAAKVFKPKILVPYHQGTFKAQDVADALKGTGIDVRVEVLG